MTTSIGFRVSDIMENDLQEIKNEMGLLNLSETVRVVVGQYLLKRRQDKYGKENLKEVQSNE